MANIRHFVLVLGSLLALSLAQAQLGLQTYARPDLGFSIGHPGSWQVTENVDDGDFFFVLAPAVGSSGSGEVAVEVLLGSDVTTTLEESVAQVLQELFANFPGFREVRRSDVVVAGLPAKLIEVSGTDQRQNQVSWQLVFVLNGTRGYLVILESLTPLVATHQPVLDQIMASFVLTPVQAGLTPGNQPLAPGNQPLTPLAPASPPPLTGGGGQPQPSGDYGSIAIGQPVSGTLAAIPDQNSLIYHTYVVTVPAGTPSLTISVQGGGADLDLAVNVGRPIANYDDVDFLDTSETPDPSFTIEDPPPGPIYIDVLNLLQSPAPYTVVVTSGGAGLGGGGLTTPGTSPLAPSGQNPLAPSGQDPLAPPGQNPLAPAQLDPFVGTFASQELGLDLAGSGGQYSGQLRFGQQVFPVSAQGSANTLNGSFESGGTAFPFSATLDGITLTFVTDGQSYILQKVP